MNWIAPKREWSCTDILIAERTRLNDRGERRCADQRAGLERVRQLYERL